MNLHAVYCLRENTSILRNYFKNKKTDLVVFARWSQAQPLAILNVTDCRLYSRQKQESEISGSFHIKLNGRCNSMFQNLLVFVYFIAF